MGGRYGSEVVIEFKSIPVLYWYHQKSPDRSKDLPGFVIAPNQAEDKRAALISSYVHVELLHMAPSCPLPLIIHKAMKNIKQLIRKLQTALNMRDIPVTVEEKTFWSIKYKRIMTKYTVKIRWPDRKADKVIETYSAAEVVKALAAELQKAESP